jgi:cell wall-associated NlpC family hydrolase
MTGPDLAAAAAALVGVPYRMHGRDPLGGLDCVGVVAAAFAACDRPIEVPQGYGLRNRAVDNLLALAARAGLAATDAPMAPGDVLLVRPGPGQHHLLVATASDRFVHAHAGLRRVVFQSAPLAWRIERRWRLVSSKDC